MKKQTWTYHLRKSIPGLMIAGVRRRGHAILNDERWPNKPHLGVGVAPPEVLEHLSAQYHGVCWYVGDREGGCRISPLDVEKHLAGLGRLTRRGKLDYYLTTEVEVAR